MESPNGRNEAYGKKKSRRRGALTLPGVYEDDNKSKEVTEQAPKEVEGQPGDAQGAQRSRSSAEARNPTSWNLSRRINCCGRDLVDRGYHVEFNVISQSGFSTIRVKVLVR